MRARNRRGFGWKRWSRAWLYEALGLFAGYRVQRWAASESAFRAIGRITLDANPGRKAAYGKSVRAV
jgi:hypothetical protein